jgi:7-cyano-7-deazaguanine synthase
MKPALWCTEHEIENLALATLAANPFLDATPTFFTSFEAMIHEAIGERVQISRPFERLTKNQVLEMGRDLPLELTFSCLSPVRGMHCGRCNKCAERHRGFQEAGFQDRTTYATRPRLTAHSSTLR